MAGPRTCCNSLLADGDELAGGTPIEGSCTPTPTSAISRAFTSAPAQVLAPTVGLPGRYTDEDL